MRFSVSSRGRVYENLSKSFRKDSQMILEWILKYECLQGQTVKIALSLFSLNISKIKREVSKTF